MATSGFRLGRYQLLETLGEGAFGTVYRAWDPELEREVALKALHPVLAIDPEVGRRFRAEAQALARLHHPNIVPVYDTGWADGQPFFTMRLIEGSTLANLVAPGRGLSLAQLTPILRSLASAIDYLHGAGLVHRDIKPSNVMLDAAGFVVLMDFGVARSLDTSYPTYTGAMMGTPAYMAPEQVRGEHVGPPADIYALGVLTYDLLAGRPPFVGDTIHVIHAHAYEPPPPLRAFRPDLPDSVEVAIEAALAKDPVWRPSSAGELIYALASATPTGPHTHIWTEMQLPRASAARQAAVVLFDLFAMTGAAAIIFSGLLSERLPQSVAGWLAGTPVAAESAAMLFASFYLFLGCWVFMIFAWVVPGWKLKASGMTPGCAIFGVRAVDEKTGRPLAALGQREALARVLKGVPRPDPPSGRIPGRSEAYLRRTLLRTQGIIAVRDDRNPSPIGWPPLQRWPLQFLFTTLAAIGIFAVLFAFAFAIVVLSSS